MKALTRTAAATSLGALLILGCSGTASAGDGVRDPGKPPGGGNSGGTSSNGTIGSQVQYKTNFKGSPEASHLAAGNGPWEPPACWTQPKYTPEQYKKNQEKTAPVDPATGETLPGWDKGEDFHKGDEGAWWYRTYAVDQLKSGHVEFGELEKCTTIPGIQWVEEQGGPDDAISPLALAGLAFAETQLPAPQVALRPNADKQIVNLGTKVDFDAPLEPVWVTARFNHLGVDIAATTVATPVGLRVDAGTEFADPQSCTYDLARTKSGYQVNTSESECNVTYRKSSDDGTYPLKAQITWQVTWTDSADPDGAPQQPALPDGLSTFEQPVEVREIQSINREPRD